MIFPGDIVVSKYGSVASMWKLDPTTRFDYDEQSMHVPILSKHDHMLVISCTEAVTDFAIVLLDGKIGYASIGLLDKVL